MSLLIPQDMQQFVASVIRQGEYQSESEVVSAALRLLEQRNQLRAEIQKGMDSASIPADEAFARLKQRARELAEQRS